MLHGILACCSCRVGKDKWGKTFRVDPPRKNHRALPTAPGILVKCQALAMTLSDNNIIKDLYMFGNQPEAEAHLIKTPSVLPSLLLDL